jgi:phosphotransferase system IIB component
MTRVRAKVVCHEIVICEGWSQKANDGKGGQVEARRFKMQIVHGTSEEDRLYSAISGGTAVELQTINADVFDMFKVKGKYYVDFTPAPED